MYWYYSHNIVWWLLLRVVVVVVVAMPLVRGDVGVRSAFFVCGLWFVVFVLLLCWCGFRLWCVPSII